MKNVIITILILAGLFVSGCGPEKTADESGQSDLKLISVTPSNNQLKIAWHSIRGRLIAGYNIYVSEKPRQASTTIKPFNTTPFSGDTNQDDDVEYFEAKKLDNGKRYYVWVEIVFSDRTKSAPSRTVEVVCNPRGEIELSVRFKSDQDGFSFAGGKYTEAKAADNDVYYYNKEKIDYLASAHRLDGFLRANEFAVIGSVNSLEKATERVLADKKLNWGDRVEIRAGDWVVVRSADGSKTILNILSFSGNDAGRKVNIWYAHSNAVAGTYYF